MVCEMVVGREGGILVRSERRKKTGDRETRGEGDDEVEATGVARMK